jgi:hypothetical protein
VLAGGGEFVLLGELGASRGLYCCARSVAFVPRVLPPLAACALLMIVLRDDYGGLAQPDVVLSRLRSLLVFYCRH